jgi:hypothetical protein
MKILERFVLYQDDTEALFPGLTRASNGDLLVSFCTRFDCLPGGEAFLVRSSDEGLTWSGPQSVLRSKKPQGCINLSVGLTTLANGRILYPCCDACITRKWDQHEASLIILHSDDDGQTWTGQKPLEVGVKEPFAYGRIVQLGNGDLLCPIWGKRRDEEAWRSGLVRSRDNGQTWGDYCTIAYDPDAGPTKAGAAGEIHGAGFNETTLLELEQGHLLAVLRQQGVKGGNRELHRSRSTDGGLTWSEPELISLWGTSPSLHRDRAGNILLGYRNHLGNPQGISSPGVVVSISRDGGESWITHTVLEDPNGHRYTHEFEAGYPAFLTMRDGTIMVVFYSFDPARQVRYLACNILG